MIIMILAKPDTLELSCKTLSMSLKWECCSSHWALALSMLPSLLCYQFKEGIKIPRTVFVIKAPNQVLFNHSVGIVTDNVSQNCPCGVRSVCSCNCFRNGHSVDECWYCSFSIQHGWERIKRRCHQRNLTAIEDSMIWCAMFVQSMMLKLQLILMKSRKSDLRNF